MSILAQRIRIEPQAEPEPAIERLRLEDVSVFYGGIAAVKNVSFPIHQGEVLALIGPSGCGKTTLLRTLNRLTELTPSASHSGRILLDGEDIDEIVDTELRRRVAMVGTVVVTDGDQAMEILSEGGGAYQLFGSCVRKINLINRARLMELQTR